MSNSKYGHDVSFTQLIETGFFEALDSLSAERNDWERTVYKTANDRLYDLLSRVYSVYQDSFLNSDDKTKQALKEQLQHKLKALEIRTQKSTTVLGLLVRYVFRSDRRRTFRYLKAIEAANSHGKTSADLADWLRECGGIDEATKRSTVDIAAEQKRAALDVEVQALVSELERSSTEPLARIAIDGYCSKDPSILISSPADDGSFSVVAVFEPITKEVLKFLVRQQAMKRLEDKASMAKMNQEAAAFIRRAPANDEQVNKAA
jgi:hypothetical protein